MIWCDPRDGIGINPEGWRDLTLPRTRRSGGRAADAGFRRALTSHRRVARPVAGSCRDVRTPVFIESWGWGDAIA